MPSKDTYVNVIGVDKGTSAMLKKIQTDAESAGTGMGNAIDKGSTKAGTALSKLGQTAGNFGIPFANTISIAGEHLDQLSTKGQRATAVISEIGKVALLGGAAGLAALGGEAIKLGNDAEDAGASLKSAMTAAGDSATQFQGPLSATEKKMELLGFTTAQTDAALAHSEISTQNMGKSLSTMELAADLARAKHEDLTTATDALDKALTGNLRPLTQMGISLPIAASSAEKLKVANDAVSQAQANVNAIVSKFPDAANASSAAHAIYTTAVDKLTVAQGKANDQQAASGQILDALSQRLGGQASAYVDTFTGKTAVLTSQLKDQGAALGEFLIPKLEAVESWITKNTGTVKDLAEAIGVILGGAIVVFAEQKAASFVKGTGKMIDGLQAVVNKFFLTKGTILAGDDEIIAKNALTGASWSAMLGPIAAVAAAAAALVGGITFGIFEVLKLGQDSAKQLATITTDTNTLGNKGASDAQKKAAAANLFVQGSTPGAGNPASAPKSISKFAPTSTSPADAAKDVTDQIKQFTDSLNNNTTANNQNAIASAGNSAAKASQSAAQKEAAKVTADANQEMALQQEVLKAAEKAGAAMQKQIDKITASTKLLISDALTKANTELASAQTSFTNFAQSTQSSIYGNFSFTTAEQTGTATGQSFLGALADQAGQVNQFTDQVKMLLQNGLSQDALQQVLDAGTQAGSDIATQLLNGGADAINQANTMTAAVQNSAISLGTSAADQFYGAGVSQAQSIVDGITAESAKLAPKLKAASKKIANNLKSQVEVDLKIISSGGKIPGFATGGVVPGPKGSPLLAVVHGGETVIPNGGSSVPSGGDIYDFSGMTVVANDPQTLVNQLRSYIQMNGSLANAGVK